jgi:hypothetical protein
MAQDPIPSLLERVDPQQMEARLRYLCEDPLPFRKANYTLPGHTQSTLDEADDYLEAQLRSFGYPVDREAVPIQAYRRDYTKNPHHQYSVPLPTDPWYTGHNLYARKPGSSVPEEIIVVCSHKDSQSWIDSPGANDNAVGTVGNLEMARVLAQYPSRRTLWFLFCNEEHHPWTSITAAEGARKRGDKIIAVFNLDGLGRKSPEQAGVMVNVSAFTEPEGEVLADLMATVNEKYAIGLQQRKVQRPHPNDDDGSFVKAGFPAAIINIGSWPYGDPNYHLETDSAATVDIANAALTVKATLAALVTVDLGNA